jgi:hypothetical protein
LKLFREWESLEEQYRKMSRHADMTTAQDGTRIGTLRKTKVAIRRGKQRPARHLRRAATRTTRTFK